MEKQIMSFDQFVRKAKEASTKILEYENHTIEYITDFSKNWSKGSIVVQNEQVIKQMVENVLLTVVSEKFLNLPFGSTVVTKVFEPMTSRNNTVVFNDTLAELQKHLSTVILVDVNSSNYEYVPDTNYIRLNIHYMILNTLKRESLTKNIGLG